MNYFVLLKMVPDTVEELEIGADGKSLDQDLLRLKLADSDEHAVEQALLLKERHGGKVIAVALEAPEVNDALFTALAKGVDQAIRIAGNWSDLQSGAAAQIMAKYLAPQGKLPADALVLLRSQAIDDLEGEIGPYLAELLGAPYLGIVTSVVPDGAGIRAVKEFAGGLRGEFALPLPSVLGIQSAEKPPRYVPIAKVRAAQKTAKIETVNIPPPPSRMRFQVEKLYKPPVAGRAQMLDGSPEEVADEIVSLLAQQSLI